MAVFTKFLCFTEDVAKKVHNLSADVLKVMLTNTIPVNTNTIKANITEIAAGSGYSAGGATPAITSCVQTAGVLKLVLAVAVITAAGGSIGPFRWAVLWNDTPTSPVDPLIGWYDYGAAITLLDGESLTIDYDPSAGALTIT